MLLLLLLMVMQVAQERVCSKDPPTCSAYVQTLAAGWVILCFCSKVFMACAL